jgi:hypothetical protein
MNKRLVALLLVVFAAIVLAPSARAQRHVAFTFAHASPTRILMARGTTRADFVRARRPRRFSPGSAFGSPFYSDYDFDSGITEEPPPSILQSAPRAFPASSPAPAESVVLELQGDHWVRLTNYGQSQTGQSTDSDRPSDLSPADRASASRPVPPSEPPRELPTAVLVFRDGHQEEIRKYVINGATIYTSADYWSTGSWTRKVQIAALDIPATLKLNHDRGANFTLPSGPHEVMIRP